MDSKGFLFFYETSIKEPGTIENLFQTITSQFLQKDLVAWETKKGSSNSKISKHDTLAKISGAY